MIVVSNTSPLTNLAAIGQFELLQNLYGEINIPEGVWAELNAFGKRWPGRDEVEAAAWVKRRHVKNLGLVAALLRDLQRGEAESITLALELGADLVILDEKEGRHAAQQMDLSVMGVIGILISAKSKGIIGHVQPMLDELRRSAGFYINDTIYQEVLHQTGEIE